MRRKSIVYYIVSVFAFFVPLISTAHHMQAGDNPPILEYIRTTWKTLTRSNRNLAKAAPDPKFKAEPDGRWPVYVAQGEELQRVENELRTQVTDRGFKSIDIRRLPADTSRDLVKRQGLLYLPHPYVVPGGRFNEMYGWDSYFIQIGLLLDNDVELAKNMADNFLYEVKNYGKVLNANRTYYLGRSQPPFLTQMVLGVYQKTHDKKWLADALPQIVRYHQYWTTEPHLISATGLSRYWDSDEGPAPEVTSAETDEKGRTHYDRIKEYFKTHDVANYRLNLYYDKQTDQFTDLFYKGDRSMRESGFDPSNRFGPFSVDIIHYNPVCLNSLLFLMESQIAEILDALGNAAEAKTWRQRADIRSSRINEVLWDSRDGLYYDYDFENKHRRRYPYLTTFYPLWAGFATKEQAARVRGNLYLFEKQGGLQMSTEVSGDQWDSPFGWAPLQMIAVEGLRRYGYNEDAERVSMKFLSLVEQEYRRTGRIVEKYDVVDNDSSVSSIHFGYSANQLGFGWTNAVFLELLRQLKPENQDKLLAAGR